MRGAAGAIDLDEHDREPSMDADQLQMRSAANVSQLLRTKSARKETKHLPSELRRWLEQERAAAGRGF